MANSEENAEISLRPLVWMGDSRKNIREFPEDVRASVGYALQLVQAGETPLEAKPFKGIGRCMKSLSVMILIPIGQFML